MKQQVIDLALDEEDFVTNLINIDNKIKGGAKKSNKKTSKKSSKKTSKKSSKKTSKKSSKKCKKGQILVKGYTYTKKDGKKVKVGDKCTKDMGKPGKGPKLFSMNKEDAGLLGDYGYKMKSSSEKRQRAINKSIKVNGPLKVLRYVNALRTLQKSNKTNFNKLDKDVKYIQKKYFSS